MTNSDVNHDYISTGVTALDNMLGGKGLPAGSVVLLRGEPGSGKSTLAFQIIDAYLKQLSEKKLDGHVGLLSLEADPEIALSYAADKFQFVNLCEPTDGTPGKYAKRRISSSIALIGSKWIDRAGRTLKLLYAVLVVSVLSSMLLLREQQLLLGVSGALLVGLILALFGRWLIVHFAKLLVITKMRGLWTFVPGGWPRQSSKHASAPSLIVVDSINVLAQRLATSLRFIGFADNDIRRAVSDISWTVRNRFKGAIVVFIGEYHLRSSGIGSVISESFLCDVEILLSSEPVAGKSTRNDGIPVRYDVERDVGPNPQVVELRSFCRVLKSRATPNQARRCLYDIVDGRGLRFFENYPGDGKVTLFAENAPQRQDWKEFFEKDIPHLYPALRYEAFDRSALQRTFASQRGFRHMPVRTDAYIASFDTYWIQWYIQLCQRWDLADIVRKHNWRKGLSNEAFSAAVAELHYSLLAPTRRSSFDYGSNCSVPEDSIRKLVAGEDEIERCCRACREHFSSETGCGGLLKAIPAEPLRLFGEKKSTVIWELQGANSAGPMSECRKTANQNETSLPVSVPYNANISFVVVNAKELGRLAGCVSAKKFKDAMKSAYCAIAGVEKGSGISQEILRLIDERTAILKQDCLNFRPETWEEIIALCKSVPGSSPHKFLVETQTFDTFLCFFLEILWGLGGDLEIDECYRVINRERTEVSVERACRLLQLLFEDDIIPRNCSVEPDYIEEKFNSSPNTCENVLSTNVVRNDKNVVAAGSKRTWLFARHWHSTFVDVLTRVKDTPSSGVPDYVWGVRDITLDIMPMPISLDYFFQQQSVEERQERREDKFQGQRSGDARHHACWGDWHLAVLQGSENMELSIGLINDLMSSQKICDRAFRGAAIPTVKEFYEMYPDIEVFNIPLPGRSGVSLPDITYGKFRSTFFKSAKNRNGIFDYRHCMREIHSLIEAIHAHPREFSNKERIASAVKKTVRKIEELMYKSTLTH